MLDLKSYGELVELSENHEYVVVDCYAEWCGPCKTIAPYFQELEDLFASEKVVFAKLNIDNDSFSVFCSNQNINSIPLFILYHKGKIVSKIKGANKKALLDLVEKI
jgi:thioredoxin 1